MLFLVAIFEHLGFISTSVLCILRFCKFFVHSSLTSFSRYQQVLYCRVGMCHVEIFTIGWNWIVESAKLELEFTGYQILT